MTNNHLGRPLLTLLALVDIPLYAGKPFETVLSCLDMTFECIRIIQIIRKLFHVSHSTFADPINRARKNR